MSRKHFISLSRAVLTSHGSTFWLKLKHCIVFACSERFSFVVDCSATLGHGQEPPMGSRGPRPPSVRWEKQRSESAVANTANARKDPKKETKSKDASKVQKVVQVWPRFIRQSPPEMHAAAQAKVQRLQAALSVLGDADVVEKENLERALSRARTKAVVPPVSAQITSTKGFIEREKKRLAAAEEAVIPAVQYRDECIKALAEGERRLEELQLQEKSFVAPVPDAEAELVRLRAQVAELQGSANVHQRHTKQRICPVEDSQGWFQPSCQLGWTCRKLSSKETTVESSS